MAKYRQNSLTIDDEEQNKLELDLHQILVSMHIKDKLFASYLIRRSYAIT